MEVECLKPRVPLPRIGLYGGGAFYNESGLEKYDIIKKVELSRFNDVTVVWIGLSEDGSIQLAQGWPQWMNLTVLIDENGKYVGRQDFPEELNAMKAERTMFCILNDGGFKSRLDTEDGVKFVKKQFSALKKAFPFVAGFNWDYEGDQSSEAQNMIVKFSTAMHEIGYSQITFNVYYDPSWWIQILKTMEEKLPGFITGFDLQTYDGGAGQDPCSWISELKNSDLGSDFDAANFVFPGIAVKGLDKAYAGPLCPDEIQSRVSKWKKDCKLNGTWIWRVEEIVLPDDPAALCNMPSHPTIADYANAIHDGLTGQ